MIGRIVSTKTKNTATVLVTRTAKHPLYKKTFVRSKKYLAVNELEVKLGDIVEMIKVRPVSKKKHWRITKVIGRNMEELVSEHLQEKGAEIIAEIMPEEEKIEEMEKLEDGDLKVETEAQKAVKPKQKAKKTKKEVV